MFSLYLGIQRSLMNLMSSLGMELKWKNEWNGWTNEGSDEMEIPCV